MIVQPFEYPDRLASRSQPASDGNFNPLIGVQLFHRASSLPLALPSPSSPLVSSLPPHPPPPLLSLSFGTRKIFIKLADDRRRRSVASQKKISLRLR